MAEFVYKFLSGISNINFIKLNVACLPGLIQLVLYQSIASNGLKAMKVLKDTTIIGSMM